MQITTLPESNHLFRERTDGFSFGEGGFNAFVFDEAADLIGEQSIAMRGRTTEFDSFLTMAHGVLFGFLHSGKFDETLIELHTEAQTKLSEFVFDFVE